MKSKLKCADCVYGAIDKGFPECHIVKYNIESITEKGKNIIRSHKEMAFERNAFKDCNFYKRKLWKFWRPRGKHVI
jgi:hypothetical protein